LNFDFNNNNNYDSFDSVHNYSGYYFNNVLLKCHNSVSKYHVKRGITKTANAIIWKDSIGKHELALIEKVLRENSSGEAFFLIIRMKKVRYDFLESMTGLEFFKVNNKFFIKPKDVVEQVVVHHNFPKNDIVTLNTWYKLPRLTFNAVIDFYDQDR